MPSFLPPCAPLPGAAAIPLCWWLRDQSLSLGKASFPQWLLHPATGLHWGLCPAALGSDIGSLLPVFRKSFGHLRSRCLKCCGGLARSKLTGALPGPWGAQGSREKVI